MSDLELADLIQNLFRNESSDSRIHAQVEIQAKGLIALRPLLKGLCQYIRTTVKNDQSLHPQADTPYQQLTFGYGGMIENIFLTWEVDKQPLLDALQGLMADPDPHIRALALVCLASPFPSILGDQDHLQQIHSNIQSCQNDRVPVVRSAARFAIDQLEQLQHAFRYKSGDSVLRQRLEKSAFEVIQGIARS